MAGIATKERGWSFRGEPLAVYRCSQNQHFWQKCWLVGGLEHGFHFSILIGNVIIPTDYVIFFRGVGLNHQPEIDFLRQQLQGAKLKVALRLRKERSLQKAQIRSFQKGVTSKYMRLELIRSMILHYNQQIGASIESFGFLILCIVRKSSNSVNFVQTQ